MKLNITPAKIETLTAETEIGWTNMPAFGSGYLQFISSDLGDDEFEPAFALSDDANQALAELPLEDDADEGWSAVAHQFQSGLRESFWSAMNAAVDLRPGMTVA